MENSIFYPWLGSYGCIVLCHYPHKGLEHPQILASTTILEQTPQILREDCSWSLLLDIYLLPNSAPTAIHRGLSCVESLHLLHLQLFSSLWPLSTPPSLPPRRWRQLQQRGFRQHPCDPNSLVLSFTACQAPALMGPHSALLVLAAFLAQCVRLFQSVFRVILVNHRSGLLSKNKFELIQIYPSQQLVFLY